MRKTLCFAGRNQKEILRDPISIFFGLLFPLILLFLMTLIDRSLPEEAAMELFRPEQLAPGVSVFSLSFLALFGALLISKDRGSSFVLRLYISPLSGSGFILGYLLPLLPIAVLQTLLCTLAALPLGLNFTLKLFLLPPVCLPIAVVYIALGMIFGTLLSEKAVGSICGALLTNVSAWLSGIWFSLDLIGGVFRSIAYVLPFANAVELSRHILAGNFRESLRPLLITLAWAVGLLLLAILVFTRKMKKKT